MSDIDKAREEYKHALRSTYVSRDADECGRTYGLVDEDKADAIIAALEAELERVNERLAYAEGAAYDVWMKRAEQAEAKLAALEAEVERLRSLQGDPAMTDKPAESAVERYEHMKTAIWDLECMLPGVVFTHVLMADAAIAALKAENEELRREVERLKVCGLCCHCVGFAGNTPPSCNSPDTVQDEGAFAHFISDVLTPCHFTPSRWQRRES